MQASSDLSKKFKTTRRSFINGVLAAGAAAAVYGCSKFSSGNDDPLYMRDLGESGKDYTGARFYYGTGTHNCGGRCITRAQAKDGKIIRFLTDEAIFGYDSSGKMQAVNVNDENCAQVRACSRCRSYKFRLYHPGRLRYPMKQTKKRGDLSGFVRISWEQALDDLSKKYKITRDTYGPESVYVCLASGATTDSCTNSSHTVWRPVMFLSGGYVRHYGTYSTHQWQSIGHGYTGFPEGTASCYDGSAYVGSSINGRTNDIAQDTDIQVMWGSNYLSTNNSTAFATIRSTEKMKARGGKSLFIGPEFVDEGVAIADVWYRTKPFTDAALMHAMIYEMLIHTFDVNGNLMPDPWLDVNYLDTLVYGFFDSPEYYLNIETGEIGATEAELGSQFWIPVKSTVTVNTAAYNPMPRVTKDIAGKVIAAKKPLKKGDTGYTAPSATVHIIDWDPGIRKVNAVPAGKSLSAYVMGSDDRLRKAAYAAGSTYTAKRMSALGQTTRNAGVCSYNKPAGTKYKTKEYFSMPKSPAWAAPITGLPEAQIKELAEMYANRPDSNGKRKNIYAEWCGGQQKQADGVVTLYMLQVLHIVTNNQGRAGTGWGRGIATSYSTAGNPHQVNQPNRIYNDPIVTDGMNRNITGLDSGMLDNPMQSCTAWHNAIKITYGKELMAGGYTAKWVPDYQGRIGEPYMDDGGAKALVKWDRNPNRTVKTYRETIDGVEHEFFKWAGKDSGRDATRAGFRMVFNCGGNIFVNQHMCSNDLTDMYECLPLVNVSDAKSFCLVTFDNFLAPVARWSDYVLPAATAWEQPNVMPINNGTNLYIPTVSAPPGESKSQYDYGHEFLKKIETLDNKTGLAKAFTWGKDNMTVEENVKEQFEAMSLNTNSIYHGKSWEEFLRAPFLNSAPSAAKALNQSAMMTDFTAYLTSATVASAPFLKNYRLVKTNDPYITTSAQLYGHEYSSVHDAPQQSGRFQVYSDMYVWHFRNRFSKWHGFLPANKRGQSNTDPEGDPINYPIPVYHAYEDYFMEAYGGKDKLPQDPFLMTTTHSRYRSHSSLAENAYMRELSHKTVHGGLYSGDDWGEFALSAPESGEMQPGQGGTIPRYNRAIQRKQANATYNSLYINDQDAAARKIDDGDLLQVENPVGAVRVVAHVTKRVARGYVGLHQGSWYDPDPDDHVDDGGNANTLMAQRHSRMDHGNGQQSAMVSIKNLSKMA